VQRITKTWWIIYSISAAVGTISIPLFSGSVAALK
jgi:hypothetical protein